ncbi:hypothetical protein [Paenibacillus sacheonensis]|uniref:Uncharacterized protein n=1 Tax=Paenibacillus sacheonensis TaxID=742054 RepID=A0A7X4YMT6_9BACL|nr:hypothetical protein [Paenibacillus sacheonensis]MBM7564635.1 hypothetical protein [Paenibacillus sacheonensis]NBC69192.1 hypothetical protein [Paenibacillus sacheonensis]
MVGSWRWNVTLGIGGSLLTLLSSLDSNGLAITSLRCLYAFLAFFIVGFLFRALMAFILRPTPAAAMHQAGMDDEQTKGNAIDYSTPEQGDELNDLLKQQMDGNVRIEPGLQTEFTPLSPPKLVSTQNKEPEELAKAIRHLTGG